MFLIQPQQLPILLDAYEKGYEATIGKNENLRIKAFAISILAGGIFGVSGACFYMGASLYLGSGLLVAGVVGLIVAHTLYEISNLFSKAFKTQNLLALLEKLQRISLDFSQVRDHDQQLIKIKDYQKEVYFFYNQIAYQGTIFNLSKHLSDFFCEYFPIFSPPQVDENQVELINRIAALLPQERYAVGHIPMMPAQVARLHYPINF